MSSVAGVDPAPRADDGGPLRTIDELAAAAGLTVRTTQIGRAHV